MSNKITDEILKSIEIIVNSVVKKLDFDRTYEGVVSAVNDDGYTVKYNGTEINIKTTATNMYKKNDIVQFCIPCGCKRRAHIITSSESLTDKIYPVGSIYMSVNNVSPSTLFGGTWEQIKDKFLLSAGDTYSIGSTGGKATHTHKYGLQYGAYYGELAMEQDTNSGLLNYASDGSITLATDSVIGTNAEARVNGSTTKTSITASMNHRRGIANTSYTSNMPPYLTVFVWKRTA